MSLNPSPVCGGPAAQRVDALHREGQLPVFEPLEDRLLLSLLGIVPEFPMILYNNTGVTAYDAAADTLEVDATALFYRASAATPPNAILGGAVAMDIVVDDTGTLTGGVPGDDLVVTGGIDLDGSGAIEAGEPSGVLLTGEVTEFGFLDVGATDSFDFRFTVTGGSLTSEFVDKDIAMILTVENSSFTGSFQGDFGGGAKGTLGSTDQEIVQQLASIGDRVWLDTNADGIQDAGEVGIDGVTVNLLDGSGGFLDSTTTAGGGLYLFDSLTPGDYQIEFVAPGGYEVSPQDQGIDDAVDSDADTVTGKTIVTTLDSGETDLTWDMGLYELASIGDRVWLDANADGIQDAGEVGIDGVTVNLLDGSGGFLDSTTTAGGGLYLFDSLTPGDYQIEFIAPAGTIVSPQDQGGDDAVDSDADLTTGKTIVTTLDSGETDLTWDMGLISFTAAIDIEKYVQPVDCQQGGEGLTPGFWKQCHHFYAWTGYSPSDSYEATFGVDAPGTPTLLGALWTGGGGVNALLRHSTAALLNAAHPNIEYAYTEAQVISMVQAAFASGQYEATKNLLAVENEKGADLTDGGDPCPPPTGYGEDADVPTGPVIDVGDEVLFTYVVTNPGTVELADVVVVDDNETPGVPGDDFNPTPVLAGGFNVGDTDMDGLLDVAETWLYTATKIVTAGQHRNVGTVTGQGVLNGNPVGDPVTDEDPAHWFGGQQLGSIGDYVWHDMYHGPGHLVDGIQDASEPGIEGVLVNLLDGSGGFLASTLTDATGFYEFTGLAADTYIVEIDASNQLPGNVLMAGAWYATLQDAGIDDAADSDGDPTTLRSHLVTLSAGEHDPSIDFGFFKTCIDLIKTGPESVYAGEIITFHFRVENCGDVVLHSGAQVYDELINPHGNHLIWSGVLQPGQVEEFDRTYQTSLSGSQVTIDFETDAGGNALAAGTIIDDEWASYGIHVTTNSPTAHPAMIFDSANPTGGDWDLGTPNNTFGGPGVGYGGQAGRPGENSLSLNNILIISEDADQSDPDDNACGGSLIFTFDKPMDVEEVHVLDIDCDEGGRVKAYDVVGNLIVSRSIVRLGNNSYQVVDVDATGVSKLVVCLPSSGAVTDLVLGGECEGGELVNVATAVGHPIHPDGYGMPEVTDEDSWTVDILCPQPGSIGDRVWMDLNENGVQDDGEPGVDDVWVDLLNVNGDVIAGAVTNANGEYLFEDLPAGQYRVVFTPTEGFDFTARDVGDDALDSDADEDGATDLLTLASGQNIVTVDAGLVEAAAPSSISGFVYKDVDNDGIKDDGERGIKCVLITLTGVDDFGNAVNLTTRTDCNGFYIFEDLAAGTYTVTETQPVGYADGLDTIGSEGGVVGNDEFSDIVLAAGVDAENYNFAEQRERDGCGRRRRRRRRRSSYSYRWFNAPIFRWRC